MKKVKMTKGSYGYRPKGGSVKPIRLGESVELSDKEAARLVSLKVAAYVTAPPAPADPPQDKTGKENEPESGGSVEPDSPPELTASEPVK